MHVRDCKYKDKSSLRQLSSVVPCALVACSDRHDVMLRAAGADSCNTAVTSCRSHEAQGSQHQPVGSHSTWWSRWPCCCHTTSVDSVPSVFDWLGLVFPGQHAANAPSTMPCDGCNDCTIIHHGPPPQGGGLLKQSAEVFEKTTAFDMTDSLDCQAVGHKTRHFQLLTAVSRLDCGQSCQKKILTLCNGHCSPHVRPH
jgi:hypothetical protein